ncbi:MAG: chemotaxis response regulator protein-glutamate methylesterase [Thiomargarita sp.]|nr:chemotaxis response regulator protein-glutamate methylesterase [Thiomargarita sp.]
MKKIKVLIIDDSALIRQTLTTILNSAPDIEVVASAADPYIARKKIKQFNPDVLTLDVEMPRMNGLEFLELLMRLRPMPVIMVSVFTQENANITLKALEYGAVDFISKPQIDIADTLESYATNVINKIRLAACVKLQPFNKISPKYSVDVLLKKEHSNHNIKKTKKIIAIGASIGGIEAIKLILMQMPANSPSIVISQHIPAAFSSSFASRMNQVSAMTVSEAKDGEIIQPGHVYIAPGGTHLMIQQGSKSEYVCHLHQGILINRYCPSVDVLFRSVAQSAGSNAIGVILTGMGEDGATGIKEIHDTGAITIAQDENTSVVWGMPNKAIEQGGIDYILSLSDIAKKLKFLNVNS